MPGLDGNRPKALLLRGVVHVAPKGQIVHCALVMKLEDQVHSFQVEVVPCTLTCRGTLTSALARWRVNAWGHVNVRGGTLTSIGVR